jgi:hypothetical protein
MGRALYWLLGLLIIGTYAFVSLRGFELTTAQTRLAPGGVRGAHTGAFWYGGYRGGK